VQSGRSPAPAPTGRGRPPGDRPVLDPVLEDWEDAPLAEEELDEELLAESTPSRWVAMANLVGSSLVAVVALQVLLALIEGLSYKTDEPQGVEELRVAGPSPHGLFEARQGLFGLAPARRAHAALPRTGG
jgi:hypothetical protein